MLITIKKNIGLKEIDRLYLDLYSGIKINTVINIMLPKELTKNYLGLASSLIQFVATWTRYSNSGKLLIDIEKPTSNDIEGLYAFEYVFPIISLVWNSNGVYDKTGEVSLRNDFKEMNALVFDDMKKVKAMKGEKLLLTNFDHLPKEYGILATFEKNGRYILNENDLLESLKPSILNDVLRNSRESKSIFETVQKDFIGIVYELMKNTFEWAKDDELGVPYNPNVRGILIKFNKKKRVKLLEEYNNNNAVCKYFSSDVLKENSLGQLYFLEISVIDSGAGFIKKYKSLNNDTECSDIDIVKKCLIKHNTSARGLDKTDKGRGLDRILNILDNKGFLRIKTDKVCLYRDLISDNYKVNETNDVKQMELFDWKTYSNEVFTEYKYASGSVVTIIYPLAQNIV
ncbi:hypothetical protein [Flavobacterium sp. LB2P74]|uniref:hypothetical protein n=1 Tax=Flavobacterium sp. LB2P74 TaxID=3401717 RepID=UPI003AAB726C